MSDATPNINELKGYVASLFNLLEDPQPGLLTWREQYEHSVDRVLGFFGTAPVNQEKDLLGVDVKLPEDPTQMPKPTCASCGGEVPFFYFYVYKLASTQGTMVFQASCCPHAGCRALFIVLPLGLDPGAVATPGKANWPGVPS